MDDVLQLTVSPLELVLRGTLMYWALLLLFRFVLRRDAGNAGLSDILFVVLLGDAAQNGMIGQGQSVGDSILLVGVLAAWNYSLDWAAFHFRIVAKLTDPPALLIVKDGRILVRTARREHITRDEIETACRAQGLDSLADVRRMYFEADGSFSVLKRRR